MSASSMHEGDNAGSVRGVAPPKWGEAVWRTLDAVAQGYGDRPTPELRDAAKKFMQSWVELLPCPHCREHFAKLLEARPIDEHLDSGSELAAWIRWARSEVDKQVAASQHTKNRSIPRKPAVVKRRKNRGAPLSVTNVARNRRRAGPAASGRNTTSDTQRRLKLAEKNYIRPCMC